ncbi:MAG: isoprenyl transferase [Bacillota bacterium]|nr:isoprenyl transferase [Bacillota bacterium]
MQLFSRLFNKQNSDLKESLIDPNNIPAHIAIIMDGNGRWAKKRKLPKIIGHREGSSVLKKIVAHCDKLGVKYLTVYAFSTENWSRPKGEVEGLMSLLLEKLKNAETELGGEAVRIRVIGNVNGLSQDIQNEIKRVEKSTSKNEGIILNIAINYGGRDDIVHAAKELINDVEMGKINIEQITEEKFSEKLYTKGLPDPDLLIRTSGEKRLSNYLLWQLAYAEFWYTEALWPDFKAEHVEEAILEYQKRNRRYGGV